MTREEWLQNGIAELRPRFDAITLPLPATIYVSVAIMSDKKLGLCTAPRMSSDQNPHVFVSAVLSDPTDVLATLVHELIHAADRCTSGHRGTFATTARQLGLLPPMRTTPASPELRADLATIARRLGPYPHARLHTDDRKPQTTRMIKLTCDTCGWSCRTTRKWIDEGTPTCWCGDVLTPDPAYYVPLTSLLGIRS